MRPMTPSATSVTANTACPQLAMRMRRFLRWCEPLGAAYAVGAFECPIVPRNALLVKAVPDRDDDVEGTPDSHFQIVGPRAMPSEHFPEEDDIHSDPKEDRERTCPQALRPIAVR